MSDSLNRQAYTTDLKDDQWVILQPILTKEANQIRSGRPREVLLREVVNAIF